MDSPDPSTSHRKGARIPWFQRVLPVTVIVVALLAAAALIFPAVREQVRLSATRQAQPYVELYFPEAPQGSVSGVQVTCARDGGRVLAEFVLRSHLLEREAIAYEVAVDPTATGLETTATSGELEVAPGGTVQGRESLVLPRNQGYVLTVTLPEHAQQLRARCAGGRSA